jgi:NitT/TauT family transport system permease protein
MTVEAGNGIESVGPQPLRLPTKQRWRRLRAITVVLATQGTLLALLLGFWEDMTASDKQAALTFGSRSAIFGFLGKMARDGNFVA